MQGAIAPWAKSKVALFHPDHRRRWPSITASTARRSWRDLPEKVRRCLPPRQRTARRSRSAMTRAAGSTRSSRVFEGVIPNIERRYRETDSAWVREEMERYQNNRPCHTCDGYRLRPEALAVKIAGLHVGQVVQMSIKEAHAWVETVPDALTAPEERDRPRDPQGNPRTAWIPCQCRPRIPDAEPQCRHACRAAKASGSGWPARSARA